MKKKKVRLFAAFRNREHQSNAFDNLYGKMKKDDAFELVLYVGMLESTWAEGFGDEDGS